MYIFHEDRKGLFSHHVFFKVSAHLARPSLPRKTHRKKVFFCKINTVMKSYLILATFKSWLNIIAVNYTIESRCDVRRHDSARDNRPIIATITGAKRSRYSAFSGGGRGTSSAHPVPLICAWAHCGDAPESDVYGVGYSFNIWVI